MSSYRIYRYLVMICFDSFFFVSFRSCSASLRRINNYIFYVYVWLLRMWLCDENVPHIDEKQATNKTKIIIFFFLQMNILGIRRFRFWCSQFQFMIAMSARCSHFSVLVRFLSTRNQMTKRGRERKRTKKTHRHSLQLLLTQGRSQPQQVKPCLCLCLYTINIVCIHWLFNERCILYLCIEQIDTYIFSFQLNARGMHAYFISLSIFLLQFSFFFYFVSIFRCRAQFQLRFYLL